MTHLGWRASPRIEGPDEGLRAAGRTKDIVTAGKIEPRGTATGILYQYGTIVDQIGKKHRVQFPSLIVSGLGRHVFSASAAIKRGITTILEEGNPHLWRLASSCRYSNGKRPWV